jgi:hypothetical protein
MLIFAIQFGLEMSFDEILQGVLISHAISPPMHPPCICEGPQPMEQMTIDQNINQSTFYLLQSLPTHYYDSPLFIQRPMVVPLAS